MRGWALFSRIIGYEAVEGKPQSGQVSYLTSCDYGYLLTIAPGVVWFLMCLIEKALDIRKKWREDRDHFARSRELGHDEDSIKALETKQEAVRQRELADAVRVIVHEQSGVDEGRKNELTTLLTKRIEVFVEKHERGSYIDVRVGTQPKVPDQAEGVADSPEIIQLREKAALLQRIEQSSMRIHALEQNKEVAVKSIEPPRPRRKKG